MHIARSWAVIDRPYSVFCTASLDNRMQRVSVASCVKDIQRFDFIRHSRLNRRGSVGRKDDPAGLASSENYCGPGGYGSLPRSWHREPTTITWRSSVQLSALSCTCWLQVNTFRVLAWIRNFLSSRTNSLQAS